MAATTVVPNDGNATTLTLQFIADLRQKLAKAKIKLSQAKQKAENTQTIVTNLNDQYTEAATVAEMAKKKFTEAEKANTQLATITAFFQHRETLVNDVLTQSTETAKTIYEATKFMGHFGLDRVDAILHAAKGYNDAEKNPTAQWTNTFMTAVQTSSARGHTALKASITASTMAFTTLISSMELVSRTTHYAKQCQNYKQLMDQLIVRLGNEATLLHGRSATLKNRWQAAQANAATATAAATQAQFQVDFLQAEFNAAQKGASYIAAAAK